ncbi:MAG: ribosome maturation factor RimP [Solirubrobacterales bacterium]|nr:ribosome maturation factor RimP [Solirubrobacterales bacterium]
MTDLEQLEKTITERLDGVDPELELVALEQPARSSLRLYIDHPKGIDLAACERVTAGCRDLLADFSLEVSSPGAERPLTKPEHFRRFLGRKVRVRTAQEIGGQRNFTGTLVDADEESVALTDQERSVRIPLDRIRRSNLVSDFSGGKA